MELNKYQEQAMTTALPSALNKHYMLYGLLGEAGEIASLQAKQIRDHTDSDEVYVKLKKELGDLLWFIAGVGHIYGMKLEDIAQVNLDKLQKRAENNTLKGSGDDR